MGNEAKIVLWLGLIMIVLQLMKDWSQIRADLFTSPQLSNVNGIMGGPITPIFAGAIYSFTGGAVSPTNAAAFGAGAQAALGLPIGG